MPIVCIDQHFKVLSRTVKRRADYDDIIKSDGSLDSHWFGVKRFHNGTFVIIDNDDDFHN